MKKNVFLTLVIIFVSFVLIGSVHAAEQQENGFVKFWRGVFHWPFNAAKESGNVIADTGKQVVGTVAQEGKNVGGTLTGSGDAAKDLVVNPVKGTAETVKTGVVGTANMPKEATQESFPAEKK